MDRPLVKGERENKVKHAVELKIQWIHSKDCMQHGLKKNIL